MQLQQPGYDRDRVGLRVALYGFRNQISNSNSNFVMKNTSRPKGQWNRKKTRYESNECFTSGSSSDRFDGWSSFFSFRYFRSTVG